MGHERQVLHMPKITTKRSSNNAQQALLLVGSVLAVALDNVSTNKLIEKVQILDITKTAMRYAKLSRKSHTPTRPELPTTKGAAAKKPGIEFSGKVLRQRGPLQPEPRWPTMTTGAGESNTRASAGKDLRCGGASCECWVAAER